MKSDDLVESDYVAMRTKSLVEMVAGRKFTVSAYHHGKGVRYSDPVKNEIGKKKRQSRVVYRVRVIPKEWTLI